MIRRVPLVEGGWIEVALDLMIRGTGSNRTPDEHVGALPAEYQGWKVFLYGKPLAQTAYPATTDLSELAGWIEAAGEADLVLYGDDALFRIVEPEAVGTIWVTMGADRDGVREVWRLRQQYAWLAKKKLALLVEPTENGDRPDAERLMRLTRAVQVLSFPAGPALAGPAWASAPEENLPAPVEEFSAAPEGDESAPAWTATTDAAPAPAWAEPATAEPASAWTEPATVEPTPAEDGLSAAEFAALTEPVPAATQAPANESAAPVADELPVAESHAPVTESAQADEVEPHLSYATPSTSIERGADLTMTTPQAEQAILQRYALVRERRTTTARVQEVDAIIKGLLKEIFVSRPENGIDAAAEFEANTKKLAEVSAEFAQLTRSMARIEEEMAKLAWLKDELEI